MRCLSQVFKSPQSISTAKMKFSMSSFVLALCFFLLPAVSTAQDDFVEMTKQYPPGYYTKDVADSAMASIDWQMQQLQTVLGEYNSIRKDATAQTARLNLEIDALQEKLPIETRFIDSETRSQIVGRILNEILSAKLDMAERLVAIKELEKRLAGSKGNNAIDTLRMKETQIELETAAAKYALTKTEYERMKKLAEKNSVSNREVAQSEFALQIARLQLERVKIGIDLAQNAGKEDAAKELSNQRLSVAPIAARLKAAERFLELFVSSNPMNSAIEANKRRLATIDRKISTLNQQAAILEQKMIETKSLKNLLVQQIKRDAANAGEKEASDKKAEKNDD